MHFCRQFEAMDGASLTFSCAFGALPIRCRPEGAPRTLAALAAHLPMHADLHTPKIAGSHIYWHAPFLEDAEGRADVMDAPPGAFLYWPERQFLELVFAPLQAETAAVTLLGAVEGPLDVLLALGRHLHDNAGETVSMATLAGESVARTAPAGTSALAAARAALWAGCPAEIDVLLADRGIMHPAGPLFMAEAEARVLHETLWRCRARARRGDSLATTIAAFACERAGERLRDFCHLPVSAGHLAKMARHFAGDLEAVEGDPFEEPILIAGRLSAWLDLHIPWNAVNESIRAAQRRALAEPRPRSTPP